MYRAPMALLTLRTDKNSARFVIPVAQQCPATWMRMMQPSLLPTVIATTALIVSVCQASVSMDHIAFHALFPLLKVFETTLFVLLVHRTKILGAVMAVSWSKACTHANATPASFVTNLVLVSGAPRDLRNHKTGIRNV